MRIFSCIVEPACHDGVVNKLDFSYVGWKQACLEVLLGCARAIHF